MVQKNKSTDNELESTLKRIVGEFSKALVALRQKHIEEVKVLERKLVQKRLEELRKNF